ncbi:hypothetical protein [Paracoccus sp. 08]|uniref:hypothetical protein n=1 Tax=Paracoccus sp. 08 TaxID=2606624 RepID=UPI0020943296|nr:hypothetical protein [Paracoccus sp. 08]MCO6362996.1 hypothetical protein [Paracoccus sp. 08]
MNSLTYRARSCINNSNLKAFVAVHLPDHYPATMTESMDWPAIVAWAREELKEGFEKFEAIDFTEHDEAILELSDELHELEKGRSEDLRQQVLRREEFQLTELREAFYAGLSPDGEARHPVPYNQMLLRLTQRAYTDQVAFDGLVLHAVYMISDGRPIAPELRTFIINILLRNRERPSRGRGYKVETKYRDLVICWVITGLCDRFNLKAMRNDESKSGHFSACDAIADAMVALRRKPYSYAHVKDIWLYTDVN